MAISIGAVERGTTSRSLVSPDVVALVGRILLAAIFVMSGLGKIAQPAITIGYMRAAGLPLAPVGLAVAALIEVGGGLALILGYRVRVSATLLALFALATAAIFHSALADQNQNDPLLQEYGDSRRLVAGRGVRRRAAEPRCAAGAGSIP